MSTDLSFANNSLTTYVYEPFSYTISNPAPGTYTLTTSNSSGIPPGYIVNNGSNVVFSTSSNGMTAGTAPVFVVTATAGSTVLTSSNTVTVNAGRFLDASGAGYDRRVFTFYKNEPIPPISLVAPFAISTPTAVPTLPPGLVYTSNASNNFTITGTPVVTIPQSNYLIIGKATGSNLGKIVTSQFGLSVSNERVLLSLTGSPIVNNMAIDTPISDRVITAAYPPYPNGGTLRYSWSGLPDGISVTDSSGNTQTSPFPPEDASSTIIITGTPTVTAANAYRDANITSNVVTFTATRTNPLPQISNSEAITFAFGETVLFDTPYVPPLYSGVALDPSATYFRAQTYFQNTGSAISNIFSPDLRSDLSINFVPGTGRGYLFDISGGPGATGTASYTIRAINSNLTSRDISVPITVSNDTVTITGVDACYNFVLSRPSSLALTGYYPTNIQFSATAASEKPVTFSSSGLAGTGLSLSNISSNTVQLVGVPTTVTPLTTATVTASTVGTPATASRTFQFAVLNDDISFSQPTATQLSFIQNKAITPIQLTATTLSERPVISFSGSGMPTGVSVSTTGKISGTPSVDVSGSFNIIASTGYMNETKTYDYSLTPDSVLFLVNPTYQYYNPPAAVSIDIDGLTYSGKSLSNFQFSGFSPTYGLSIDSSSGVISGTLPEGIPPDMYSTTPDSFNVTAQAGTLNGVLPSTFTATNIIVHRSFLLADDIIGGGNSLLYTNDDDTYDSWTDRVSGGTNLSLKNTSIDSNVYLLAKGISQYLRSTNGVTWSDRFLTSNTSDFAYEFIYDSNVSIWYATGTTQILYANVFVTTAAFYTSSDDGLTWSQRAEIVMPPRQNQYITNYFTNNSLAFGSKNGVMVIGGGYSGSSEYFAASATIMRSTDGGYTWDKPDSGWFGVETCAFELSGSNWIALGSSLYSCGSAYSEFGADADTIKYSDDNGISWKITTGTVFNVTGTHVVYDGSGTWIATGLNRAPGDVNYSVVTALSYTTNGIHWSGFTLPGITFTTLTASVGMPLPEINAIWTYDSNWYLLFKSQDSATSYPVKIFSHPIGTSLTSGWTVVSDPPIPFDTLTNQYVHGFKTNYVRTGDPTTITLAFNAIPPGGPTITAPSQTSYTLYQYVQITPITIEATGTGTIYYFVESETLPIGLTFDPITATISGTPVRLGQSSFIVYAKDNVGVTPIIFSVNVIIPTVFRQQTSAGAWTSLIRQYTVVNAAQNSVNGRALPATEPPLGEFMRPEPPDSVSASGDPNCVKKC